MKKQPVSNLLITIILVVLMFVWIFITVALTGGREISDFTRTDKVIFACFGGVEILTLILCFVFGVRAGKNNEKININTRSELKPKEQKVHNVRGCFIFILSLVMGFFCVLIGITLRNIVSDIYAYWGFALAITLTALFLILNVVLKRAYLNKLDKRSVEESQAFILSHREHDEETSREKALLLKKIRTATFLYSLVFVLLGALLGICGGIALDGDDSGVFFSFISALLWLCAFSRIRFAPPKVIFEEYPTYVTDEEFPLLYETVRAAAKELGCKEEIRISLLSDCNAGIGRFGSIISVQIGMILLSVCSRDEIYNLMLHEFAHMEKNELSDVKERDYFVWITNGGTRHYLSWLTSSMYLYPDSVFCFEYQLYQYAHTLIAESEADRIMTEKGDRSLAASALLKLNYHALYCWELDGADFESIYMPEEPDKLLVTKNIERFREYIKNRKNVWRELTDREILSRSSTHPTTKMRLDAMGMSDADIIEGSDTEDFVKEKSKALEYVENLVYDERTVSYDEARDIIYVKPKSRIDDWIAEGKPVAVETYQSVVRDLRDIGMLSMAEKVCDKVIDVYDGSATAFAHYIKGIFMLHRYEDEGLEHVYYAMEKNSNGIEGGLDVIGQYCCLTGNEKELEIYRKRAVEFGQSYVDKYSELDTLTRRDKLSPEKLPEETLEYILDYIASIDNEDINKIYLVRKTLTEDYYTSVFVIDYANPDPEEQNEIQYKIYCCLDAMEHQFSLFNYLDVASVGVEKIENSCVYSRENKDD
ncbi:MAG: hypothetical protein IJA55_02680 [Clostridia bacterium]|nr:hypothetical protein [Clostridia bacterium]